jgi:hypothetical protein
VTPHVTQNQAVTKTGKTRTSAIGAQQLLRGIEGRTSLA